MLREHGFRKKAIFFIIALLVFSVLFYTVDVELLGEYFRSSTVSALRAPGSKDEETLLPRTSSRSADSSGSGIISSSGKGRRDWQRFDKSLDHPNIVYIKAKKVGGSTVGGVVRRIAWHYELSNAGPDTSRQKQLWIPKDNQPGVWACHGERQNIQKKMDQLVKPYFLLTWIRSPVSRCLSHAYYKAGGGGGNTPHKLTKQMKVKALKGCQNYNYKYIYLPKDYKHEVSKKNTPSKHIRHQSSKPTAHMNPRQKNLLSRQGFQDNFDWSTIGGRSVNEEMIRDDDDRPTFEVLEDRRTISISGRRLSTLKSIVGHEAEKEALRIVRDYDFIGIADRFKESTLVLKHVLGLKLCDVLFFKSKDSTSFSKEHKCNQQEEKERVKNDPNLKKMSEAGRKKILHAGKLITRKTLSEHKKLEDEAKEVQDTANSAAFKQANAVDYELIRLASNRLDWIIEHGIGRKRFDVEMKLYEEMMEHAVATCGLEAIGQCSWRKEQCLWRDGGCGYECLDSTVCPLFKDRELELGQQYPLRNITAISF